MLPGLDTVGGLRAVEKCSSGGVSLRPPERRIVQAFEQGLLKREESAVRDAVGTFLGVVAGLVADRTNQACVSPACGGFECPNGTGGRFVSQALATWQEGKIVVDSEAHVQVLSVDRLGQPFETEGRPVAFQFLQEL
jgi:hypothetical protein